MEMIPMRSVLVTDFGEYELPRSVAEKIDHMPLTEYFNPLGPPEEQPIKVKDMNHPPLARYYRLVERHMKRRWLAEG